MSTFNDNDNDNGIVRAFGRRTRFTGVVATLVVAGFSMVGCDVHELSDPGDLTTIAVTPDPASLAINGSQQFTAVGTDFAGVVVTFAPVWSVTSGGGTISSAGMFTAGTAPGTFTSTVKATSGSVFATATVLVTAGPLASIVVTPSTSSVGVGATSQYVAVGKDASGNVVQFTPSWSVELGGGSISTTGLFTAGTATGTFTNTVRASAGALSGTASVVVTAGPLASISVAPNPVTLAAGLSQQFTAVGSDATNNVVGISPVWSVVNGGGNINSSTGLFTAGLAAGTYNATVKATSGGVSGFATVTVTTVAVPTLATITVAPNPATMLTGGTQQFTAVGRDGNGDVFPITPMWSVENTGGSIDLNTGLFTAGIVTGTFNNTVKATSGTISGTSTVNVTAVLPPPPTPLVPLGDAAPNGIMAGTAVTCITGGTINADVSISPGNTVTGFGPCVITGTQHLADAPAAAGQIALTTAYNTLAGLPCAPANAIVADLGGTTKPAGVYCTASTIGVTGTLTLDGGGDPNATFVFQAGTSLVTAGDVVLINGAQAKNVYWQVGTSATLGTASKWQGNILSLTSITLVDNATLLGRALARNGAVTLGTNNVIILP